MCSLPVVSKVLLLKTIFRCIKHVDTELLKQRSRRALESFFIIFFFSPLCRGVKLDNECRDKMVLGCGECFPFGEISVKQGASVRARVGVQLNQLLL